MNAPDASSPAPALVAAPALRVGRLVWRLLPWLGAVALLVGITWALGASPRAVGYVAIVGAVLLCYGLLLALVTEILSPDRPELRLMRMSDGRALRLAATLRFLFFFLILTEVGAHLIEANDWHRGTADLLRVLRNVVLVLAGVGFLAASGLLRRLARGSPHTFWGAFGRLLVRLVLPVGLLAALFAVGASGLGYVPLAKYVAMKAAWTGLIVLAAALAYRWLRGLLRNTVRFYRVEDETAAEGQEGAGTSDEEDPVALGLDRIGAGLLKLIVGVAAVFAILAQWNLPPGDLFHAMSAPTAGSGQTLGRMVGGLVEVAAVLFFGWLLRNILTFFVFPRTKMGIGARYAILAMLKYVVIAVAIVFSLGAIGLDTSSLGWFFGAAGIGIGLGLQDIIGNFVSGLIMLVERPIRVGDTVQVGDATGKVESIQMRGTTLRTFDNFSVLIPNKQLLGERVTNLTYGMGHARMLINLRVPYESDPRRVQDLVMAVALRHPDVLSDPAPAVRFQDFGPTGFEFTLMAHTGNVGGRFGIASELRFGVHDSGKAEGIEVPYPRQELHLRSGWGTETEMTQSSELPPATT